MSEVFKNGRGVTRYYQWCHSWSRNNLSFPSTWVHPTAFCGICVAQSFVL